MRGAVTEAMTMFLLRKHHDMTQMFVVCGCDFLVPGKAIIAAMGGQLKMEPNVVAPALPQLFM